MQKKIKLIVGLANHGCKYNNTRHNIGSWYIKLLAKKNEKKLKEKKIFSGFITNIKYGINDIVYLFIPKTYMNICGKSIKKIIKFYNISTEQIIIVHDEIDFPPGVVKLKLGGNNCSHNGIKNIQKEINSNNFYRLRIGIGRPKNKKELIKFVLDIPSIYEKKMILNAINKVLIYTDDLLIKGIIYTMNILNKKPSNQTIMKAI